MTGTCCAYTYRRLRSMDTVSDITPDHYPSSLLETAKAHVHNAKAIAIAIVGEDDTLWFDCCGHANQSVLWCLEHMKIQVLVDSNPKEYTD